MCNIDSSLEESGEIHNFVKILAKVLKEKPKALTLLMAEDNNYDLEKLDQILQNIKIPISGGVFPKIIFKDKMLNKGSIFISWYNEVSIINYKNIENVVHVKNLISSASTQSTSSSNDNGEYLIFIDSALPQLEKNIDVLFKKTGFRARFSGAVAGHTNLKSKPCIITNEGLLQNAMQTIAINHVSEITTTHGWKKQSGPHLVTSSKNALVKSLNYEPIISFYKKHNTLFGDHHSKKTTFSSFFNEYPIGIENIDGEILVREPIRFTEKSIEYIGNIPEYSKIHILSGTEDSARQEVNKELEELEINKNMDTSFIFSSIARDDADHNGYSKEINMLKKHVSKSKNIIGALSKGEIATSNSGLLQLHNKSIVISQLSNTSKL